MVHLSGRAQRRRGDACTRLGGLLALSLVLAACGPGVRGAHAGAQVKDHYWQLGVGCYLGGMQRLTELDVARFDWVYLCFGNIGATRETTELLNRLLAINPRLKIMVRLWPIMGKGDCKQNRYQATMWHYLYKPGVKQRVLQTVHDQVHIVLDHITKPENVVGLTFLEEMPGHFTARPMNKQSDVGWAMERFRKEIEAERGKRLVWNDDTRRWWGTKYVHVINEIHAAMKKASKGRLVFYYQATGNASLDLVPPGTALSKRGLVPISWKDIIRPGLCDGFFAYPNSAKIWQGYVRVARANNWLLFSQVSHPRLMRLCAWQECLRLAKMRFPQNVGYFFYCSGDCSKGPAGRADKSIPPGPKWNTPGVSNTLHIRRHLALEKVGMDVVCGHPPLRLRVDLPLAQAKPGTSLDVYVVVENTRDESFFENPRDAIARDVTVTLATPPRFRRHPTESPDATLTLGTMKPGEHRLARWRVQVSQRFTGKLSEPFVVTGRAEGSPPTEVKTTQDVAVPFGQAQEIGVPGTTWTEAAFRLPGNQDEIKPRIVVEALGQQVHRPAVGDGSNTIRYDAVLEPGTRLVMDPPRTARVFVSAAVNDDGQGRGDQSDPSGFKPFDQRYMVLRYRASTPVGADRALRVTIAGKAVGGANSHVILRFRLADGKTRDEGTLTNRFKAEWCEVNSEVKPPAGAVSLQNVYLYRFGSKGRIWYGPVKVERADADPAGTDVSARLRGTFPSLSRTQVQTYRYTDDDPPSLAPRVRVRLHVPKP